MKSCIISRKHNYRAGDLNRGTGLTAISLKRSTQILQLSTSYRPITPSILALSGDKQTWPGKAKIDAANRSRHKPDRNIALR